MEATASTPRMPAATRSASTGRPASASPTARVPSKPSRRSGSHPSSWRTSCSCADPSSHRSDSAASRAIMFQPNRPTRSTWLSSASSAMACAASALLERQSPVSVAAIDCSIMRRPSCGCPPAASRARLAVAASTASRNRRLSTRRWHHANSIIASRSPEATLSGICAMVRSMVATRPESYSSPTFPASSRSASRGRPARSHCSSALRHLADVLEPPRGTRVQEGHALRCASRDLAEELLPHHGVHLEPAGRTEPGDEQPTGLGVGEQVARVGAAGQRGGERPVGPHDDGRVQEDVDDLRTLRGEHLAPDVVGEQEPTGVDPRKGDRLRAVRARRERGELQSRRPAAGPVDRRGDLVVLERRLEAGQHLLGLLRREPQLGEVHLDQLPSGTQPVDRELGRAAGQQHHVQPGRQGGEEVRERVDQGRVVVEEVDVVEDQHAPTPGGRCARAAR